MPDILQPSHQENTNPYTLTRVAGNTPELLTPQETLDRGERQIVVASPGNDPDPDMETGISGFAFLRELVTRL